MSHEANISMMSDSACPVRIACSICFASEAIPAAPMNRDRGEGGWFKPYDRQLMSS
jgi:hypothetical protein